MKPQPSRVFAIHATSRGFAYAVFNSPFCPHDWGAVTARTGGTKSVACLNKIDKLLDRYTPESIVLEEFGRGKSDRKPRLTRLYRAIASLAASRSIEVFVYAKAQIQACFVGVGARTRHEIADAIARQFEMFRHKLPKIRKPWQSEHRGMALFCAVALVVTHYSLGASSLFESLRE
jgi:Holliday junction resolvasome RuvABC endonuclease subunit